MSDYITPINCINKMGISHSIKCHYQVPKIYEWEISQKNHLSAAHILEKLNTVNDKKSRSNHVDAALMLQSMFLILALEYLCFKPEIDLLALNVNTQFGKYSALKQDSGDIYIDAFRIE